MNKSQDQEKSFFTKITSLFGKKKSEQNNSTDSLKNYAPSNQLMSENNVTEIKNKVAESLEALQPRYPKHTPTIITGEEIQLTDRQKDILLKDGSIGIPFKDNSEDYAEWKLYLDKDKDKDISVYYYTGEEFLMKRSDLFKTAEQDIDRYNELGQRSANIENGAEPLSKVEDAELKKLHNKIHSIDAQKENSNVFLLENLNITNEQRKNASDYEMFGKIGDFSLTEEQSAKIPDVIGDLTLSPSDKTNLALGEIRIERLGESYQIQDNKILKTYLNEDLNERKVFINQNEVKFNKSNAVEIISENQSKNIAYLSKQMKYLGFKETPELKNELTSKVNSNADNFIITQSTDKNFFRNNEITFDLKFNKSQESQMYFLNSYDIKLNNSENAKNLTHNVDLKKIPFTHKEAVNLIEGRSVRTDVTMKNGDKESVFLNINFQKQLDNKKGFELNKFFQNYGTKTDEILTKSNVFIAENKEELKDRIIKSLEKGNVVPVLIKGKEGEAKNYNAVLNPEYKTLNLYDSKMQRVNINESLANGVKVEKQKTTTSVQQNNSRKI